MCAKFIYRDFSNKYFLSRSSEKWNLLEIGFPIINEKTDFLKEVFYIEDLMLIHFYRVFVEYVFMIIKRLKYR